MRKAPAFGCALVVALAITAPEAHAAGGLLDPGRQRLSSQIDRAVGAADHIGRAGIQAVRLAGVPAVLVTRDATLAEVHAAVPRAVRLARPGLFELDRLLVVRGATLTIGAPQVQELRLLAHGDRFATIVGRNGSLRFAGRRGENLLVRSWDAATHAPDADLGDGRASVSIRGAGRLDASDTSFEDLGFSEGRVSGVAVTSPRRPAAGPAAPARAAAIVPGLPRPEALRGPGVGLYAPVLTVRGQAGAAQTAAATDPPLSARPSGALVRSRFMRNVFGGYSYEAQNMRWIDNEFRDNLIYGLDPHDNSDGFLVEGNVAAGNARHGIIFSRFCDDNVIRDNRTFANGWHGIVIDDGNRGDGPSNRNVIAGNDVRDNLRVGISIDGSSHNLVTGNRIDGQRYGVRVFRRSSGNVVRNNRITHSAEYGVFIDGADSARVRSNVVADARTGTRLRSATGSRVTSNTLLAMREHGVEVDGDRGSLAAGNVVSDNHISGAGTSPILSTVGHDDLVTRDNRERWDYPVLHDLARGLSWFVGPGLWVLLLLAVVFGPLPGRARRAWR
jgi:parallel beta-helix repeat protein